MSEKHAIINYNAERGTFTIKDLFSTNGTYVPTEKSFEKLSGDWALNDACEIRFGVVRTFFRDMSGSSVPDNVDDRVDKVVDNPSAHGMSASTHTASTQEVMSFLAGIDPRASMTSSTLPQNPETEQIDRNAFANTTFNFSFADSVSNDATALASSSSSSSSCSFVSAPAAATETNAKTANLETQPFEASQSPVSCVVTQPRSLK